jgi:hypothetical protein
VWARQTLAELMTRRRQPVDMRVAEHSHLEPAGLEAGRSIHRVIKLLDKQSGPMLPNHSLQPTSSGRGPPAAESPVPCRSREPVGLASTTV